MLFAICFSLIYILNYARAIDEVTALNRRRFISSARLEYVKQKRQELQQQQQLQGAAKSQIFPSFIDSNVNNIQAPINTVESPSTSADATGNAAVVSPVSNFRNIPTSIQDVIAEPEAIKIPLCAYIEEEVQEPKESTNTGSESG